MVFKYIFEPNMAVVMAMFGRKSGEAFLAAIGSLLDLSDLT
jgi:ACR3 family arsenite efflux pump ArsB